MVQVRRQVSRATVSSYKTHQERAVTSRTGQGSEAVELSVQQGARHVDVQPSPLRRRQGFLEARGESAV